ncbi:MAG: hypothetical protein JWN41_1252 [Thermoleophilia bacterium]|nr:hypothetical protein [Thermoleophilia bacterium]
MGETFVKLRMGFALLCAGSLVVAGCGSNNSDDSKKSSKTTKTSATASQTANKQQALDTAKKAFDKKPTDINTCRDLAMKYIAVASPESSSDPKVAPKQPKNRDENLKSASKTLRGCLKIDAKNRDVQQMLASTYMARNKYDDAAPLLKQIALSSKRVEAANAFYAWGLAAGNAQNYDDAISAWSKFVALSPAKDPRVAQVKQSIAALRVAKKQAAAPAKSAATTGKGSNTADTTSTSDTSKKSTSAKGDQ